jgi:hypothetical protein
LGACCLNLPFKGYDYEEIHGDQNMYHNYEPEQNVKDVELQSDSVEYIIRGLRLEEDGGLTYYLSTGEDSH